MAAGFEVVGVKLVGAGHQDLGWALGRMVDHGRGKAVRGLRTWRLPALAAGFSVQRDEVGSCVLIAEQQKHAAGQDRRGARAVGRVQRVDRVAPALIAVRAIREQSEIFEEDVHIFAVGDGTR